MDVTLEASRSNGFSWPWCGCCCWLRCCWGCCWWCWWCVIRSCLRNLARRFWNQTCQWYVIMFTTVRWRRQQVSCSFNSWPLDGDIYMLRVILLSKRSKVVVKPHLKVNDWPRNAKTISKTLSIKKNIVKKWNLNASFCQIDFDSQFFTEKNVRIMGLVKRMFQLLQLEIGESRPTHSNIVNSYLHLKNVICKLYRYLLCFRFIGPWLPDICWCWVTPKCPCWDRVEVEGESSSPLSWFWISGERRASSSTTGWPPSAK